MEAKNSRLITTKLSEAAYLIGVKGIPCAEMFINPIDSGRVCFAFNISKEEGEKLILEFYASESCRFDSAVKSNKGKVFQLIREAKGTLDLQRD